MSRTLDEKIEAGKEILSYCGKCKADTDHIISAVEHNQISKVMCRTCNAQHNYRKPKSLVKDKLVKKVAKKSKFARSSGKSTKKFADKWNELLLNYNLDSAPKYNMKQNYEESDIIDHPSFGIGVITKKVDENKIEVCFEAGFKRLIINKR